MTAGILIELGWPAKALSPNYRSHSHWPRTNAIKKARLEGFRATKAALRGAVYRHEGGRLAFVITAYPPTTHARDDDNLLASLKGHRDGIADALKVDDALFDQRLQWGAPTKPAKIVVEVRP